MSPDFRRIALLPFPNRVMDVIVTVSRGKERDHMPAFTIDADNNVTAFENELEATASSNVPIDIFSSEKEMAKLASVWPEERLVSLWNSLPGVQPTTRFKSRKVAISRIWKRISGLGGSKTSAQKATTAARKPHSATSKVKSGKKASVARRAPKAPTKPSKTNREVRDGSKTAKILDLLKRPDGVTLKELMKASGWQPHSLRGFISGTLGKKMGLKVESAKRENGERVYSLQK
jgi:hypothetical protein